MLYHYAYVHRSRVKGFQIAGCGHSSNESSLLLDEARRKRFYSKMAQLLYLGKRIRMDILTAVAFLTTRVTKATEEDDGKLLRVLKYLFGTPERSA